MKKADESQLNTYATFSAQLLEKIKGNGSIVTYEKGTCIFRDKYATENIFILIEGKASIYKMNDNGQKRIIFILDEGSLLNEPTSVNMPLSIDCAAFENCKVLAIERNVFLDLMSKDFELTKIVINQVSHKARRMYRQLKNANASTKVEKKVAAKLWKLCQDYGIESEGGTLIDIQISSNNLADLMGVRRETVSRSIKILQDEGLIIYKKRKIFVFDPEELAKFFKSM